MEIEKDFFKRQLAQLAQFLKRLLGRARDEGDPQTALDELGRKGGELLGVPLHFLDLAEPASAAVLLRTPEKMVAYADLLAARAELEELSGELARAQASRARAQAVRDAVNSGV
jgi:hypothetical protein